MNTVDRSESRSALRIAFIGGGSGGHLFPAIAVAHEMLSADSKCRFLFLTSDRSVDRQVLEKSALPDSTTQIEPYVTTSAWRGVVRSVAQVRLLLQSLSTAKRCLKIFQPDIVVGLGALASVPGVFAASRMKLPVVLLEQNCLPGKATQALARSAKLTIFGLPVAAELLQSWPTPHQSCGTPVRIDIRKLIDTPVSDISARKRILILGGSQGAHSVNCIASQALTEGLPLLSDWEIVHQTGIADVAAIRELYQRHGITARVAAFLPDMPEELSSASIAISRAGAVTIQEMACAGLPSILIPLSTAANKHQMINARLLEKAAAAYVIDEAHPTAVASTNAALRMILSNVERRQNLSTAIRTFAAPNAAPEIVQILRNISRKTM